MKGYLTVPGWQGKTAATSKWIENALKFSRGLPAKAKPAKKKTG
jgi:hypothetical protein